MVSAEQGVAVGPHPHIGLQTVTWLTQGEVLHRDSLGSEQLLRAGELNLMTAGHGVAHAEESPSGAVGTQEGIQLWVAQPEATRNGPAAFHHHGDLPEVELGGGLAVVLVGSYGGEVSPAAVATPLVGLELTVRTRTSLALDPGFEHAVIVIDGGVRIDGEVLEPGFLGFLGTGRDDLDLDPVVPTRAMLLGGAPFDEHLEMWWNFVGRDREELHEAYASWVEDDGRFGTVDSHLARVLAHAPPRRGAR
jgi:redox-sensitive bicupin YhaK (pirin superfamily)